MKRIISIGLVLLMSIQCFYKLGVIAYFQLNREYIAEVLCVNKEKPITMCYGQCFLKKNLSLADENQKTPVKTNTEKFDFPDFMVAGVSSAPDQIMDSAIANTSYKHSLGQDPTSAIFHPPSLSC